MAVKRYGHKLARDAGEAARMNNLLQMLKCDPDAFPIRAPVML